MKGENRSSDPPIFLTGGTGFLGSHLAEILRLLENTFHLLRPPQLSRHSPWIGGYIKRWIMLFQMTTGLIIRNF